MIVCVLLCIIVGVRALSQVVWMLVGVTAGATLAIPLNTLIA
jgi:hypothetical protein